MKKDTIYQKSDNFGKNFAFDKKTVEVFADMINRSVPAYNVMLDMIGLFIKEYSKKNTNIYDLGCSLGFTTKIIKQNSADNCQIIAVDNSQDMIKKCKENLAMLDNTKIIVEDINNIEIKNSSIVLLNLTLQFIDVKKRQTLINNIYKGLVDNGILLLIEKIHFDNKSKQNFIDNMHFIFKQNNGYSDLEIAKKRQAIDNVLITNSKKEHIKRIKQAKFTQVYTWFNCFNFMGFIAIK